MDCNMRHALAAYRKGWGQAVDKFLEIIGSLGVSAVLLVMIMIVGNSGGGSATAITILGLLPWAVPAVVGFIIIAAFGNMLGQLKAIRAATERQAAVFQAIADRRAP
jgi:hypothetical protein